MTIFHGDMRPVPKDHPARPKRLPFPPPARTTFADLGHSVVPWACLLAGIVVVYVMVFA